MLSQELVAAIQMEREREIRRAGRWPGSKATPHRSFVARVRAELQRQRREADELLLELTLFQEVDR